MKILLVVMVIIWFCGSMMKIMLFLWDQKKKCSFDSPVKFACLPHANRARKPAS